MILSLVAAVSDNDVIGNDGKLPWSLPDDLKHFHDLTVGHPVIMGRKTYESIPEKRRPLPDRLNIVLTRQAMDIPDCTVVHSLAEALSFLQSTIQSSEVFVIGGAEVYREAIPLAQRMYLTRIHALVDGDAFFPDVDWDEWREVAREEHPADARHAHAFTFLTYARGIGETA